MYRIPAGLAPQFSAKVVEHFLHPQHSGVLDAGQLPPGEALLTGDAGQVTRGDGLRLYVKISKDSETILDARFQNFGTGLPIASASVLCGMIIGKSLEQALRVTASDLDRDLDGLPELQRRQPVLALDALDAAIRKLRGIPPRERARPGETMLCSCNQVSEAAVERAIRTRGLKTVAQVVEATRAGGGCHTCRPEIEELLARCRERQYRQHIPQMEFETASRIYGSPLPPLEELMANPPPVLDRSAKTAADGFVYPDQSPVATVAARIAAKPDAPKRPLPAAPWAQLTYLDRVRAVEDVLEYDLRPAIRADGGDIKLVDVRDERVLVTLQGHCKSCHSAGMTLKSGVEKRLRQALNPEIEVEEVIEWA